MDNAWRKTMAEERPEGDLESMHHFCQLGARIELWEDVLKCTSLAAANE